MGGPLLPGPKATEQSPLNPGGKESKAPKWWVWLRSQRELMTLFACLLFMTCSATMLIVNKVVIQHFQTPTIVLLSQNLMAIGICCTILYQTLHYGSRRDIFTFVRAVPLFYSAMLASSSVAQLYASLGLQVVVRNITPLVTLPVERIFNEPILVDVWTWSSMLFILFGILLYVVESLGLAPYHVEHARKQDSSTLALGILLMLFNMTVGLAHMRSSSDARLFSIIASSTGCHAGTALPTTNAGDHAGRYIQNGDDVAQ